MLYKQEFPDYDDSLYCPAGFMDYSYHNDMMPHVEREIKVGDVPTTIRIWQDYKNLEKREYEEYPRYAFQVLVDDDIIYEYSTDSLDQVKKLVADLDAVVKKAVDGMKEARAYSIIKKILEGVSVRSALLEAAPKIKEAFAVYTGGGIWLFYGKLSNGNWFLTDDYGATRILNADPSDLDVSTYEEWQLEHLVKDLIGKDRLTFCDALCDYLEKADQSHRGGITNSELDAYRDYFKKEF